MTEVIAVTGPKIITKIKITTIVSVKNPKPLGDAESSALDMVTQCLIVDYYKLKS